jgi:uncharacterized membrane protein
MLRNDILRREALREYAGGALWLAPFLAANVAIGIGFLVSRISVPAGSPLSVLAFHGNADDARTALLAIAGTVVTVIALVLGLSVVALQLSSTQFSPRLLRNFLRDKPNQLFLSIFMATFAYSAAGLYTVGTATGAEREEFPRVAVSGAIGLLFLSLAVVVIFADHLSHSIQIDAIMRRVERETLAVIRSIPDDVEDAVPPPPADAVPLRAARSGYVQTVHPEALLPVATRYGAVVVLRRRVGEHVVAGSTMGWVWCRDAGRPVPDRTRFEHAVADAVLVGFERTRQQDVAIGIRQLVDVASKALSPAVNDPYTAVQAVDHLAVIFSAMARHRLGNRVARSGDGEVAVVVPSRRFGEYLATMFGLVRRYGAAEPTVSLALLHLLEDVREAVGDDPERLHDIAEQAHLVLADAERAIVQPADLVAVRLAAHALLDTVDRAATAPAPVPDPARPTTPA